MGFTFSLNIFFYLRMENLSQKVQNWISILKKNIRFESVEVNVLCIVCPVCHSDEMSVITALPHPRAFKLSSNSVGRSQTNKWTGGRTPPSTLSPCFVINTHMRLLFDQLMI